MNLLFHTVTVFLLFVGSFRSSIAQDTDILKIPFLGPFLLTPKDVLRCHNETKNTRRDPDIRRNITELIEAQGYEVETHTVETDDGYILTLFRIPHPKNDSSTITRKVVLLNHGLLGSSTEYVIQKDGRNLAMKLAEAGYDVWLNNHRGTSFSTGHVKYTQRNRKYWDFSWHEMGVYDVPAVIDFILEKTGQEKLFYVGHSQGSTQVIVTLSEREEYNDKIETAFLLSPSVYQQHSPSMFKAMAVLAYNAQYLFDPLLGGKVQGDILDKYFHTSIGQICAPLGLLSCPLCGNAYTLAFGYDGPQCDFARLNVMLSKNPDSAATKCLVHYAQNMVQRPAAFRQFDYLTSRENEKRYGAGITEPPAYNLSKVTTRVVAFHSDSDNFGHPKDTAMTWSKINNNPESELVRVDWPLFHHLDYAFAKDADLLIYNYILEVMARQN